MLIPDCIHHELHMQWGRREEVISFFGLCYRITYIHAYWTLRSLRAGLPCQTLQGAEARTHEGSSSAHGNRCNTVTSVHALSLLELRGALEVPVSLRDPVRLKRHKQTADIRTIGSRVELNFGTTTKLLESWIRGSNAVGDVTIVFSTLWRHADDFIGLEEQIDKPPVLGEPPELLTFCILNHSQVAECNFMESICLQPTYTVASRSTLGVFPEKKTLERRPRSRTRIFSATFCKHTQRILFSSKCLRLSGNSSPLQSVNNFVGVFWATCQTGKTYRRALCSVRASVASSPWRTLPGGRDTTTISTIH